jgi:endoribonuclease LACTB2
VDTKKAATPKDAAAIILLSEDLTGVLWARRNPQLKFLGGFHGFAGGKVEPNDGETEVRNCAERERAVHLAAAVRETFEETGILLVRGGDKLTKGQRISLHDDLVSERSTFAEILEFWGLWIDAEDFIYTGFWTTPAFSPIRFKTRFFIAVCPPKQEPYAAVTELLDVEFIAPEKAVRSWSDSKVLIAPPVLIALRELAENKDLNKAAKNLRQMSEEADGDLSYIEFNSRVVCLPLRTETLPPATHTNCFIVGGREFVVIDAASPFPDEQTKLFELVDQLIEKGSVCQEIIVSHLHPDHFGGETPLKNHLKEKFGLDVPISTHEITAESLGEKISPEKFVTDGQIYELKDAAGNPFELKALHLPGHARGHLCFYDAELGFLLSSDNVVSPGTVVIAPPEGNMTDYLDSLERMKNLPQLNFLCGSHGTAVADAGGWIETYIEHRLEREKQIAEAFESGARTPSEIVPLVYRNLDPKLFRLAEKSVAAHLERLFAGRS